MTSSKFILVMWGIQFWNKKTQQWERCMTESRDFDLTMNEARDVILKYRSAIMLVQHRMPREDNDNA